MNSEESDLNDWYRLRPITPVLIPPGMKAAFLIQTLVSMRTEEVPLRLDEVGRQAS